MNLFRRLAAWIHRPRPVDIDPQLAELERALRRPAARHRNTPGRGNR